MKKTMIAQKWNRKNKRKLIQTDDDLIAPKISAQREYKVSRVRSRRKKVKHPGFTTLPAHRLWIFEGNK